MGADEVHSLEVVSAWVRDKLAAHQGLPQRVGSGWSLGRLEMIRAEQCQTLCWIAAAALLAETSLCCSHAHLILLLLPHADRFKNPHSPTLLALEEPHSFLQLHSSEAPHHAPTHSDLCVNLCSVNCRLDREAAQGVCRRPAAAPAQWGQAVGAASC